KGVQGNERLGNNVSDIDVLLIGQLWRSVIDARVLGQEVAQCNSDIVLQAGRLYLLVESIEHPVHQFQILFALGRRVSELIRKLARRDVRTDRSKTQGTLVSRS